LRSSVAGRFCALWSNPVFAGAFALVVYGFTAAVHVNGGLGNASQFAYFNYLADAFLHGQTYLRVLPSTTHDLSTFDGRWMLYWPPFPAVLLMPFVALFGVGFSDIAFTAVIGAIDVALVAALLNEIDRRELAKLDATVRGLLVLTVAFGSVLFTLAPFGRVWFTAQAIGVAATLCAYLAVLKSPSNLGAFVSGIGIACTLTTRNHLVLTAVWPLWCWWAQTPRAERLRRLSAFAAPIAASVLLLALYNYARFNSPFENGLRFHTMGWEYTDDYARYGAFHLHYLATNFYYQYLYSPAPLRANSYMGGSLFLMTPVFLAAFWGLAQKDRPKLERLALGLSVLFTAVPILLLMGTGYVQWGPRYTIDFLPPLLVLTALGIGRWPRALVAVVTFVSILQYAYGAHVFTKHL
jgi:hypothetical protein